MMDTEMDMTLRRLGAQAAHPGLDGIEDAILTRVHAAGAQRSSGPRLAIVAAVGAVTLGTLAAGPYAAPAAAPSLAPFGASSPLAPSTLLLGDR